MWQQAGEGDTPGNPGLRDIREAEEEHSRPQAEEQHERPEAEEQHERLEAEEQHERPEAEEQHDRLEAGGQSCMRLSLSWRSSSAGWRGRRVVRPVERMMMI